LFQPFPSGPIIGSEKDFSLPLSRGTRFASSTGSMNGSNVSLLWLPPLQHAHGMLYVDCVCRVRLRGSRIGEWGKKFFCLRPDPLSVGPSFQLTDSTSRRFVHKRVVGLTQDGSRVLISQDKGLRDCFQDRGEDCVEREVNALQMMPVRWDARSLLG